MLREQKKALKSCQWKSVCHSRRSPHPAPAARGVDVRILPGLQADILRRSLCGQEVVCTRVSPEAYALRVS